MTQCDRETAHHREKRSDGYRARAAASCPAAAFNPHETARYYHSVFLVA
jgi:hypothetical protein